MAYWKVLTKDCMSDEMILRPGIHLMAFPKCFLLSSIVIVTFHCVVLTSFLYKLDDRCRKKLGRNTSRVIKRVYGTVRDCGPPKRLPAWMIHKDFQRSSTSGSSPSICTPPSTPSSLSQPQHQYTPWSEQNFGST